MGWTRRSAAVSVLMVLDEHRKEVGRKVVQLREGKAWSQEKLAHEAGVSTKTVSRLENGERETRRYILRKVADALGVNEIDLLGQPPAPLGLGAREDQVSGGFEEFRDHVADIRSDLAELKQLLVAARSEREAIRALLKTQESILQDMQRVAKGLPGDEALELVSRAAQTVRERAEAAAESRGETQGTAPGTRRRRATGQ
jgi:transcriptional regulator with XRE-family HTH domain